MLATVQGGSLNRWFEELCRIKVWRLRDVTTQGGTRLLPGDRLPVNGGVYAFWWTGASDLLKPPKCNRRISLVGPGGRRVLLEIDDDWLGLATGLPVPLYVGKSAASIRRRVGQHLMLNRERVIRVGKGFEKAKAPTTSCQLRAGVEHLFPKETDTRSLVIDNVGVSYVVLDGPANAANRFYLEDMAVGLMRPPLNVDIER
jgi:hypothetical protein